jgi:hypothetical protein
VHIFEPIQVRPRGIGELLDATFRFYRRYFRIFMLATVAIYVPYLILQSILDIHTQNVLSTIVAQAKTSTALTQTFAKESANLMESVGMVLLSTFLITPLLYGTILHVIMGASSGEPQPSGKDAFVHAMSRLLTVVGVNIVRWLIYFVALTVAAMVGGLLFGIMKGLGVTTVLAVTILVLVGIVLLILMLWLYIRLVFAQAVTLEEHRSVFSSIGRSWVLSRGNFWRVTAYLLLIEIITVALSLGIGVVATLIHAGIVSTIILNILTLFVVPITMIATATMYIDLRVRSDADDLAAQIPEATI